MTFLLSALFIFLARVIDMSLGTLRILMLMRGRSLNASLIGFFESLLYIAALGEVIKRLDNPLNMVFFAGGFAAGNFVGSFIEERIALGYVNVQVISVEAHETLQTTLREAGFGVTSLDCCGKDGMHHILYILLRRRDLDRLIKLINAEDPRAFVSIFDARKILGGFFPPRKSK